MSMLMGEGINSGEVDENFEKITETDIDKNVQDRMSILQNFASMSARVPDAKHSKSRQKKILQKLQEELKHEN